MFHELKMKSLKKNLLLIIVFFVVAAVFCGISVPDYLLLLKGPQNLDEMTADEIGNGLYVKGTISFIYGSYANTTKTQNGNSEVVSEEYVIPVGENSYMGLVTSGSDMEKSRTLLNESEMYMDDQSYEITGSFEVTGTIRTMDSESLRYYRDALGYDEMGSEDQALFLPYYLQAGKIGSGDFGSLIFFTILGVLFLVLAVVFLVRALSGSGQKMLKQYCGAHVGADEKLEQFYRTTEPVNGLRVNHNYLLGSTADGNAIFLTTDDLVWAYTHVTRTRMYGLITVGKTYVVALRTRDGKQHMHRVKNENQAKEVLERIHEEWPWVLIGYSDELDKAYSKDRSSVLKAVDERRGEQKYGDGQ